MAEIITFTNQKGGVGKTSLAMNFGTRLGTVKAKVLFVDMDPQCSLTYIMNVDNPKHTVYDVLVGNVDINDAIIHADEGDILAASPSLSTLDISTSGQGKEFLLRDALAKVADKYHFIVIDSPPTLGLLTINILCAANSVIIPALADVFSLQGVGQLYSTIQAVRAHSNPNVKITGIILSRHTDRYLLSRDIKEMMQNVANQIETRVFDSTIRESVILREAQASRESIFKYAPRSKQAMDYENFIMEYLEKSGYVENN